ncbi:hypothetical protein [Inquilinus sp. Marseille-Q2685]|uniref:hypothetical protein n=1 Tax=Inquilinus sp. Marseille-Q2685 TaxID=2866581 RepID=UPI001CE493B0|nr:hypothetical protein [Inquilinus sp. Marseille-Q2685]
MTCNFRERFGAVGAVCLAILSAVIVFPFSASAAATPQQCATLRTLINNTTTFEKTVLEQQKSLLALPAILAGKVMALQVRYEGFAKDEFRGIETVIERLHGISSALSEGFDGRLKVLDDSVTVVNDLCR